MGFLSHKFVSSRRPAPERGDPTESDSVKAETLLTIARNVVLRVGRDNLMLVAAGVAFYAMTAIFPATAAFVSIYGLFADPKAVPAEVAQFAGLLPPTALNILTGALQSFAKKSNSTLNTALVVSVVFALWSAKAGVSALITGLNIANETTEKRGFIVLQALALSLTFGLIVFAMISLSAIALVPAIAPFLGVSEGTATLLAIGRWPLLAILVCLGLAAIYRFGPYRTRAKWRWITWGAAIATALWLAGSGIFSLYVSRFASYDATYGSLAAPVVLLLWFWLSALVVLLGAEIDAELEHGDAKKVRPLPEGAP